MTREQIRLVLQGGMTSSMEANLDPHDMRYLARMAEAKLFDGFSQADVARTCGVNQSAASKISRRLEDAGYITSVDTNARGKAGRPVRRYHATAPARLAFGAPPPAALAPGVR
ncbi:MAG TPA: helix-turn-helix domain-containing protein [Longimicrobium sp.]|nr:helix-turn-helix domain-containing protein [Longimicrobium sp.]